MTVHLSDSLRSDYSLSGLRVHIVRGGAWGDGVAEQIRARGGVPVVTELLRIQSAEVSGPLLDAAVRWNRGDFEWLILTSANAVDAFAAVGGKPQSSGRVAAVGPATAEAAVRQGFTVNLVPQERFSAAGLVEAFEQLLGVEEARTCSMLLPVSDLADQNLERALTKSGHDVERVTAYRTVTVSPVLNPFEDTGLGGEHDDRPVPAPREAILVTSSSAARAIAEHLVPLPAGVILAAIGDPTAGTLRGEGLWPDAIAATHTIPGLLDALASFHARDVPASVSSTSVPTERQH